MTTLLAYAKKPISQWLTILLPAAMYGGVLALFFLLKITYKQFCLERIFRDTLSYVKVGELPFSSLGFWAGERSFTLPLVYKLLGVTSQNFELPETMARVSMVQTWFSAFCWLLLAGAAALQVRSRWLRPLAFAAVILFSATLPVSFWDTLMLSESISTSLFALVCAGWLFWLWYLRTSRSSWLGWLLVALQGFSAVLYAFVRDSNIYFVVLGALLFGLWVGWKQGLPRFKKVQAMLYGLIIIAVLLISNVNINQGNRWQVFLYDQLALNILPDPAAREYFAQAGLPVDDKLMAITSMPGYQYQSLLKTAPEMAPVKQWVDQEGKSAYLRYLLVNGLDSLFEPLVKAKALISPGTRGYLYPRFPGLPYPRRITLVSQVFYVDSFPFALAAWVVVILASLYFWARSRFQFAGWGFVFFLLASLYPMMFLIWHGEPMEVDRHAAQLGIQLRLAAWIFIVLLADQASTAWANRHRRLPGF